ncbi:MAG: type 2 isopentenyl-diphosphate Delta-isomerase [Nitrososphaerota archaeon]|nr:type 2 isopentenyl-diphosphate Delta-isomerase [Candidatus Calditenuaceae archaeon]MDW8073212.1 type 2 isopentenyl-diphosphate Delta-isomerase [Nitrososphaerota archaeon]
MSIEERKRDHIRIALESESAQRGSNWLEYVHMIPRAVPDINVNDVEISATFLGRWFSAPFLIEGMTGGTEEGARINAVLAAAAERARIPMGVGSQRAGIVRPELRYTFRAAREAGQGAFLIANIGAAQLVKHGVGLAWEAVKMIEADALAIHVNLIQEIIQPEGDREFRGFLKLARDVCREIGVPVIVKEVGCGISYEDAVALKNIGISAVDVAGKGGTSWIEIERMRALDAGRHDRARLAEVFTDWGIPTAASVLEAVKVEGLEVVGSGGIRNGLEVAKLLLLGASMGGMAMPFLRAAVRGVEEVENLVRQLGEELKVTMALCGATNLAEFKKTQYILTGRLREWVEQRAASRLSLGPQPKL